MNVAVGFNPRREFRRDASVAERRLNRRALTAVVSVVATRLGGGFRLRSVG